MQNNVSQVLWHCTEYNVFMYEYEKYRSDVITHIMLRSWYLVIVTNGHAVRGGFMLNK